MTHFSFRILYQSVTKNINIILTEQILQLIVEVWKIIVNNYRGAAALMIDSSMKAFNGDPDAIDSNISYSQTDPQTARFAESFKVKIPFSPNEQNTFISRRSINELKMNTIVSLNPLESMVQQAKLRVV